MGQLSSMASNNALMWLIIISFRSDLIENGNDENCSLTHTGFSLTKNILSLKSLRDGIDLNLAGMFKTTLSDGSF